MDWRLLIEPTIKAGLLFFTLATGFAYLTLFERRVLARMQSRIGPNRVGPWGLLQPAADGIKLFFKEELIPARADRALFVLAPVITVIPALIILAVIPFGPDLNLFGLTISQSIAGDFNVGVLYLLAVSSIAVYGITLAGWSSGNKYALLGGLRAAAQMVSYELALGLTFVIPIILAGSMSLRDIVAAQQGLADWFIWKQPLGFLILFVASIAEINRAPFDLPEAEQELVAGFHTEYSGMKFALFFMAEYIKMIAVSVIAVTFFLGGFWGPFVDSYPVLGPVYLVAKVVLLLFVIIWLRATLPRLRYDRLMGLGWKILLPLSLVAVAWTAGYVVLVGG
ncbi:MAG TPA: NADH-quinone oxidoreductase subunit NuoH [Anaerolineales bacterium]|jgi:NADH-quinone oxidoreductase subunit H